MKYLLRHIILLMLLFANMSSFAQDETDTTSIAETMTPSEDSNVLRNISAEEWNKMKDDKAFIYKKEKKVQKKKPVETKPIADIGNFFTSGFFRVLMFLIVGILLLLVIRHLFFTGENNFLRWRKNVKERSDASFENVEVFSQWDIALKEALQKKDYRLSVRVLYLQTLQMMHQQGWIVFEQEKTNWDYVQQLNRQDHRQSFTLLTRYFDYIWYGSFGIDRERYLVIETLYRQFQAHIR
jgi:hypothetical protein